MAKSRGIERRNWRIWCCMTMRRSCMVYSRSYRVSRKCCSRAVFDRGFAAAAVKAGGDVFLIRLLVLAEAHIAVDAIDRLFGIGDEFWREPAQIGVQAFDQLAHGALDLLLENRLARLKPLAAVVARQTAEEIERFAGEAGERHLTIVF